MFRQLSKRYHSDLLDQDTFDKPFQKDLHCCKESLVIESPFIRLKRVEALLPTLSRLRRRGVKVIINTRNPNEHNKEYELQATIAIALLHELGVRVLFTVKHHRKLAIIDRAVFYEGSLNVLSYYDSCEIMRRTASAEDAETLIRFVGLKKYL